MKDRRLIKQTRPWRSLGDTLLVFHWQRSYALTGFHSAAMEKREMTDAEIASDAEEPPRYSFTAFRAPEGDSADRQKLRDLLVSTGFRKRVDRGDWVASEAGEEAVLQLKLALKAQGVAAVHYNEIPDLMLVRVVVEGQL